MTKKIGDYAKYEEQIVQVVAVREEGHYEVKDINDRSFFVDELELQ